MVSWLLTYWWVVALGVGILLAVVVMKKVVKMILSLGLLAILGLLAVLGMMPSLRAYGGCYEASNVVWAREEDRDVGAKEYCDLDKESLGGLRACVEKVDEQSWIPDGWLERAAGYINNDMVSVDMLEADHEARCAAVYTVEGETGS